jgi:pilus assembly protein CpaB
VSIIVKDTDENREWLKGRRVDRDIAPGSLLLYEYFNAKPANRFAARIEAGKRAMSIEASATSAVSFLLEPGSRVDLVGTIELEPRRSPDPNNAGSLERTKTETILQNVRVLAVGDISTRGAYANSEETSYATVTIELSPEEVERLVFARARLSDTLNLVLRNPADSAIAPLPDRPASQLNSAG